MTDILSQDEIERYKRHILLPEVGGEGQQRLKNARVLVIGAGGLGAPVLQYLAAAGVGTLGIADDDHVSLSNLQRQVIHDSGTLNELKTASAAQAIARLNPNVRVMRFEERFDESFAATHLKRFDLLVDGSDNFSTRYLVNDTCVELKKPLVYGSILKFEGQIAVFNHNGSKNLRDLFPEMPDPKDVPNCNLNGVLGTLPGIIGNMMAHETLKLILELPTLNNELILFNTLNWNFTKLNF